MKICGMGLESPLEIYPGEPTILEIHNKVLFSRVCQSLTTCDISSAPESFSVWSEDEEELHINTAFIKIQTPLDLPWDDKALSVTLYRLVEQRLYEEFETREEIEQLAREINSHINEFSLQVEGNYGFTIEWDLRRYLKAFAFRPIVDSSASIFDNLILFLEICSDMKINQSLLFINLKLFLSENELKEFYNQVFFLGLRVLMLESIPDNRVFLRERKRCIDLHFLES